MELRVADDGDVFLLTDEVAGQRDDVAMSNRFLAHLKGRNFARATRRAYAYDVLNFLRFLAGQGTLTEGCADSAETEATRRWEQWATDEARRIDPINSPDSLSYLEPDTVRPEDYERFMPKGMSAHRRPTE